jgi:lycopene beta-cyclase
MDATVDQIDGYRFVYCLPFSPTEIFVEDTYYSDDKAIDAEATRERIASYAAERGWEIEVILEEERGQLPVLYGGDFEKFWAKDAGVRARAGARAALIQPITSYSLPLAVKTAMMMSDLPDITQSKLDQALTDFARAHWDDSRFYRMLCAMMFKAAKPEQRYRTLEHTYAKDKPLIERFYAGKTTLRDKMKLLSGRPPVPIFQALRIILRYR